MSASGADFSPAPGRGLAQYSKISMGQHGQGDVAVPADPRAHFVLIQPDLVLGRFEATLDGPARAGHPHQFGKGCRCRSERQIKDPMRVDGSLSW